MHKEQDKLSAFFFFLVFGLLEITRISIHLYNMLPSAEARFKMYLASTRLGCLCSYRFIVSWVAVAQQLISIWFAYISLHQ